MGLDIKFETKDYVLLSVTIVGLFVLYFILKNSVNTINDKIDEQSSRITTSDVKRNSLSAQTTQVSTQVSQLTSQLTQLNAQVTQLNTKLNITGNVINFPSNSNVCIGDGCMSYDGSRFIISKPLTVLSNSHAGLDIRRTTKNATDGDWNYTIYKLFRKPNVLVWNKLFWKQRFRTTLKSYLIFKDILEYKHSWPSG
jgi:outer membrane murein-binding lipoprotein Lpp